LTLAPHYIVNWQTDDCVYRLHQRHLWSMLSTCLLDDESLRCRLSMLKIVLLISTPSLTSLWVYVHTVKLFRVSMWRYHQCRLVMVLIVQRWCAGCSVSCWESLLQHVSVVS